MTAILRALRTLFLASFTFASACVVAAQTNPFVGTWKWVPERSHFDRSAGSTAPQDIKLRFLIDKDQLRGEVEISLSNGNKRTWVLIPQYDRQEHPLIMSGETIHKTHAVLWTRVDDRTIECSINHDNGLEYTTDRFSVSPDGQTLTQTHSVKRPDGTAYEQFFVTFVRQ